MSDRNQSEILKRAAAERALTEVQGGMRIGLGSGSTARWVIAGLGRMVAGGLKVTTVATSEQSAALARQAGIEVTELTSDELDLAIDGADEFDPHGNLIKGWGGALLREKIVAAAAHRFVVVVDHTKRVDRLGSRGKLPVEIVKWGAARTIQRLAAYHPVVRTSADGSPFVTDNGNLILDCAVQPLADPGRLQDDLKAVPGVVETGLFLHMAQRVLVAAPDGVAVLDFPAPGN